MKIIIYTLNTDGTVPEYVIDGGYFPTDSQLPHPKDLFLVGIANENAFQDAIPTQIDLQNYLESISEGWVDIEGQPFNSDEAASWLWAKLELAG
jgi:hypothetical protein